MKKVWLILIIILIILIGLVFYVRDVFHPDKMCTSDCQRVCSPELGCCYREDCVSGNCGQRSGGVDVKDYEEIGYLRMYSQNFIDYNLSDWPTCEGRLAKP